MHAEAYAYIARHSTGKQVTVLDIGGRHINGSPRGLFPLASAYLVVDLEDGPGVDVVADIRDWDPAGRTYDVVVCAEVLEHTPDPAGVVKTAMGLLAASGRLILTCAGPGRAPHSGHHGGPLEPGEHYANVDPDDLDGWITGLSDVEVVYAPGPCDVYATGVKGST